MKKALLFLLMMGLFSVTFTSCVECTDPNGCSYSGGGYYDDPYDDDDYDDDWDDGWDDDDDWDDDYDDDWDDGWDDDDDDCWDCGDDWGWYDDSQRESSSHSTDIMGDVASNEQVKLSKASAFYANRFNLSDDQGLRLAKTINDFETLQTRSATDLAEFSQRLYGLNPEEIVTSISSAQVGDHSELESVIEKAAKTFDTTPSNMKEIIKTLHKTALKENGIEL